MCAREEIAIGVGGENDVGGVVSVAVMGVVGGAGGTTTGAVEDVAT